MALVRVFSFDATPRHIWDERLKLADDQQGVMNSAPILCMHDGKLKMNMDTVQSIQVSNDAKDLLSRFRESLKRMNVQECLPTTASNVSLSASGVNKRKESEKSNVPESISKQYSQSEQKETHETFSAKRICMEKNEHIKPQLAYTHVNLEKKRSTDYDNGINELEVLCVPCGTSSHDRLTFYNVRDQMLTRTYVEIATNSYDLMPTKYIIPSSNYKILMVDGTGFRSGGSTTLQHSIRLAAHRKTCTNKWCNVLGCGNDPTFKLFAHPDEDIKVQYEKHWRCSNKSGMRAAGVALRRRAYDA